MAFHIFGLSVVSLLVFVTCAKAQDRNLYRTNDVKVLVPTSRQAPATPLPTYQLNGQAINKYINSENDVESIKPYEFGYQLNDGNGTTQHRQEVRLENGDIRGSYGYLDPFGMYREVEYYTDSTGYHAKVKSNEPGLFNKNSANTVFVVENPPKMALIPQQQRPLLLVPKAVV
ncbi:uncharacterized protein LOC129231815 [Uloborus diversus]|uniref:uncharacterized protein LOC129231815 n=1 Tax=Uloborus diversus TaxID=327109 RepID=UPI00240A22C5|nr:uncharacterized protein LOC129231815 [Uloborus diversus]